MPEGETPGGEEKRERGGGGRGTTTQIDTKRKWQERRGKIRRRVRVKEDDTGKLKEKSTKRTKDEQKGGETRRKQDSVREKMRRKRSSRTVALLALSPSICSELRRRHSFRSPSTHSRRFT